MTAAPIKLLEPQYAASFEEPPVTLGPMASSTWRWDPRRLGIMLARYKFVAKMFEGLVNVAEIGCADGFGSAVVKQAVKNLDLYDCDPVWVAAAKASDIWCPVSVHDIVSHGPLPGGRLDGIYMLDVLEHIKPADEAFALSNICFSLKPDGVFIAGSPSLESQAYASAGSKAGHVNCRTGANFRDAMRRRFRNVFLFGMNDEVLHTGFAPMCHYQLVLCCGPKNGI